MIHDVVENCSDRPRELDVNGSSDLAIEETPFVEVIEPTNFRVSVVKQDDEAHELVPEQLWEDDSEQDGEPDRGLRLNRDQNGNGDLGNHEECNGRSVGG
jgi:hypothetical protein